MYRAFWLAINFILSAGLEPHVVVPFADFLAGVRNASFAEIASRNDDVHLKVRNEAAFLDMKQHILAHYEGVTVTRSFLHVHPFDCVTIESQPSLRGSKLAVPPPALLQDAHHERIAAVLGDKDTHCDPGTFPMLRVSLERTMRHATLQHFFAKSPHGPAVVPAKSTKAFADAAVPHKYAHASQSVKNFGGSSSLGLWNPQGYFTLSQQWYSAFTSSNNTVQTAECGSLHYPGFYGDQPGLFLYRTNNGYAENSGCYNLDCKGFVQVDKSVALGKAWQAYSSDGHRVAAKYAFQLFQGNWWFQLNGTNVGYYPTSIYSQVDPSAMAVAATGVDFGGETTTTEGADWPQMGSGKFADAGWTHAAAHAQIEYYRAETPTTAVYAHLQTNQDSPSCYTIDEYENDANAGTWFSFGGPGAGFKSCGNTSSEPIVV